MIIRDLWQFEREDKRNNVYLNCLGKPHVVVYNQNNDLKIWVGKSVKPKYNYWIENTQAKHNIIMEIVNKEVINCNKKIKDKERINQLKKEYIPQVKEGDIFHGVWGYDMTLHEFYRVLNIKGRKLTLVKLGIDMVDVGYLQYHVKPNNCVIGTAFDKILQIDLSNPSKPCEYIKLDHKRLYNVTEDVKSGKHWFQNECD